MTPCWWLPVAAALGLSGVFGFFKFIYFKCKCLKGYYKGYQVADKIFILFHCYYNLYWVLPCQHGQGSLPSGPADSILWTNSTARFGASNPQGVAEEVVQGQCATVSYCRWGRFKPFIPTIIMGNVRSITNKTDELGALTRTQREYRECNIMCFTEM